MLKRLLRSLRANNEFIELLSEPPFLSFSLSVFLSQIAYNMMSVTLIFLIFHLTFSNLSVSIIVLTYLVPQMLLSFFGGVVADLRNKKLIMFYGNLLRGIVILLLFLNTTSPLLVYIVSFVISVITQFYIPAEAPMIPRLVKKNHLITANSIFGIGFFSSILIGYILAGVLILLIGRSNIFLVLSVLFLFAALFAYLVPDHRKQDIEKDIHDIEEIVESSVEGIGVDDISDLPVAHRIVHNLKTCYKFLRETGRAGNAFFLLAFSQVVIMVLATIVPGYARAILHVKAEDLSLLLFAPAAVGMVLAAILVSGKLKYANKDTLMNIGIFVSGFSLALFPLSGKINALNILGIISINSHSFAVIVAFFAGFSNALIFIPSQTIIQETVPKEFSSKIYGLLFAVIGILSFIPIILAGTLADIIGVGSVLVGVGIVILLTGIVKIELISGFFRKRLNR